MTWYKKAAIALAILLLLFLLAGLFMPKNMEISQKRTIKAPVSFVFNLLNNVKTSKEWNPFVQEDPKMELSYSNIREGKGAQMTWISEVTGNGSNIYTNVVDNKLIESDLMFEGMDTSQYAFIFEPKDNQSTDLTWTMKSRFGFPYNVMGPVFKYMIKKSYKKGLDNIEKVVNERLTKGLYSGYAITEMIGQERKYAMNRKIVPVKDVTGFYTQSLGVIFQKIQNEGLTMTGKPVALFFNYDEVNSVTDMAAGAPINLAKEIKDLSFISIPSQLVVQAEHKGPYEGLATVHEAINTYIKDHSLTKNGPAIEEYVSDPVIEKDPQKYITKIIYPVTKSK